MCIETVSARAELAHRGGNTPMAPHPPASSSDQSSFTLTSRRLAGVGQRDSTTYQPVAVAVHGSIPPKVPIDFVELSRTALRVESFD